MFPKYIIFFWLVEFFSLNKIKEFRCRILSGWKKNFNHTQKKIGSKLNYNPNDYKVLKSKSNEKKNLKDIDEKDMY